MFNKLIISFVIFSSFSIASTKDNIKYNGLVENRTIYYEEILKKNPFYKVELIIFEHPYDEKAIKDKKKYKLSYPNKLNFLNSENIYNEFNKINITKKINLNENIELDEFYVMEKNSDDNLLLKSTYQKLKKSNFKLLFHETWIQEILSRESSLATPINGGNQYNKNFELQGYIRLSKDRYLHLNTNLWLSKFEQNNTSLFSINKKNDADTISSLINKTHNTLPKLPTDSEGDKLREEVKLNKEIMYQINKILDDLLYLKDNEIIDKTFNMTSRDIVINDLNIIEVSGKNFSVEYTHVLNQSRKLTEGAPYYIDHPRFGLIIYLEKYNYGEN